MKLVSIAANPLPGQAVCGAIKTPDRIDLRFARWAAPPRCKGTVVLLQGRAEFIEKYFETVRDLQGRGFAVVTFDWRGQGLSGRRFTNRNKGYVRNFSDYAIDLETIMETVVLPDCPPPIFALGHSMGAAVAIHACHSGHRWFDRMVLSAPLIALPLGRLDGMAALLLRGVRFVGGGSASVTARAPSVGTDDFIANILTSDPVRFTRNAAVLEAEPALKLGAPTIAWVDAALAQMRKFADPVYVAAIRQPILMVAAGGDKVVSTPAIEAFGTRLAAGRHLMIAGARHELLQEQDRYRAQFWAAFDAFVPGTSRF